MAVVGFRGTVCQEEDKAVKVCDERAGSQVTCVQQSRCVQV